MILGSFLKQKRIDALLSQGEASRLLGYERSQFLSNVERGKRAPSCDLLRRMCVVYKVDEKEMREQWIEARVIKSKNHATKCWEGSSRS
ncbi:MAG: helix-turn-helix transcriptional regulator [Bdellovibrio sp.]|nr:helix-turn-helix transcriptional regulator [Bdellovibrio sp.]